MKQILKILSIVCVIALTFTSCAFFKKSELKKDTTKLIDAIINNESETAYEYVKSISSKENFPEKFEEMRALLSGVDSYELKTIEYERKLSNGVTTERAMYGLYADAGNFVIIASKSSEIDGFSEFMISPDHQNILPPLDAD